MSSVDEAERNQLFNGSFGQFGPWLYSFWGWVITDETLLSRLQTSYSEYRQENCYSFTFKKVFLLSFPFLFLFFFLFKPKQEIHGAVQGKLSYQQGRPAISHFPVCGANKQYLTSVDAHSRDSIIVFNSCLCSSVPSQQANTSLLLCRAVQEGNELHPNSDPNSIIIRCECGHRHSRDQVWFSGTTRDSVITAR